MERLFHAVLLALLTFCSTASAIQLLKNADFEKALTDWSCVSCTVGYTQDSHSGKNSLLAYYRTAAWNGPGQELDIKQVKPRQQYQFSSYVKLVPHVPVDGSDTLLASIRHSFADGSKDQFQNIARIPNVAMNKWLDFSARFTVQDFRRPVKSLFLYIEGPRGGINIQLDDVSLTQVFTANNWKTAAKQRIESIRKGDLTVSIQSDTSLTGVELKIEQLTHEFGFGTAVDAAFLKSNAAYRQWYLDNFEWAVLENAMKWRQNEWNQNAFTYSNADEAMKILEENGKKVRGHAIFWAVQERVPNWIQAITNKKTLYGLCKKRATDVVTRYKGRLEHWDVNNEMMAGQFFADKYGSSSIRYDMFRWTRQIDPKVKLFLNDFNVISNGQRLSKYINQAYEFKAANVSLGGIGVQGHLTARPQGPILLERLDKLAKVGLPIWVTELDYKNKDDQARADALEDSLTAFFSHPSVDGVLFWGFYENKHWRGKDAALVNGPKMTPNAAGRMWQRLFHTQWRSNVVRKMTHVKAAQTISTSARVFYGQYKISVSVNGKVMNSRIVSMSKNDGSLNVRIPLTTNVIG